MCSSRNRATISTTSAPSAWHPVVVERWLAVLVIGAVLALALTFAWAYATRKNAWPNLTPPAHNEP